MSTAPQQKPAQDVKPAKKRSNREMLRTGSMIALAVLITLFAVLNTEEVKVDWIVGSAHAPVIVVIVISVLVGVVFAYMAERRNRKRR